MCSAFSDAADSFYEAVTARAPLPANKSPSPFSQGAGLKLTEPHLTGI